MLLGVSRQSVTKWEAEKSYPEMDKLLKICQIFECSLDDLVQGDLTGRPLAPASEAIPAGPPTDVCGYDEHMRRFALRIAVGVAAIILGVAATAFASEAGFFRDQALADTLAVTLLFVGVLAGCALLVPAGMEHSAFTKAHPYIEDFYTDSQKSEARGLFARCLIAGLAAIFAGIVVADLLDSYSEAASGASILSLIAAGAGLIVYGGIMLSRVNLSERNMEALSELEVEDIAAAADLTPERRNELIAAKNGPTGRKQKLIGSVCGVIMLVATAIALTWLFLGMPSGPVDAVDWGEWGKQSYFWLPWPIGGICCGIASILIEAFYKDE